MRAVVLTASCSEHRRLSGSVDANVMSEQIELDSLRNLNVALVADEYIVSLIDVDVNARKSSCESLVVNVFSRVSNNRLLLLLLRNE